MKIFLSALRLLWSRRGLLYLTVKSDIKARYAGSALGLSWLIFYPFMFLSAYSFIYLVVFNVRLGIFTSYEYIVLIFCGLIPFLSFSEALGSGTSSVTANANVVRNTMFPVELLPVKAVLVSQSIQVVGSIMLLIAVAAVGKLTFWVLLFPVIWISQIMFTIGVLWIFAAVNVFLRDLQALISVLILMLMLVSPIAYTVDMVPENLRPLLSINPLYYIIIPYQEILIGGKYPSDHALEMLVIISLTVFTFGYWVISRMKMVFADNV